MADRLTAFAVWDTLECDGGSEISALELPYDARDTFSLEGEERLTVIADALDPNFGDVQHERVLRLTFADAEVQEWRVRDIDTVRGNDNSLTAVLTCESIRYDLIHNASILERVEANGQVKTHFELYGLTPSQHVAIILAAAPAYFAAGTIADIAEFEFNWKEGISVVFHRVDMIYHQDSPLSALTELAKVAGLELDITRNGSTNYLVNLIAQRGEAASTLVVEHADNLLSQRRVTHSADIVTVIYPRGGQDYGNEGSMEGALFRAASISGSTVTFYDELFGEDDQLNGGTYFVEDPAGSFIEITDTVAPNQIVLASPPAAGHGWFGFRREVTTGVGTVYGALTFLPSPTSIAAYGTKPGQLDRPDIPLIDNLVPNPQLQDDAWSGSLPNGYRLVGSPGAAKNTDPLYTRHGGASLHLSTSADGQGVATNPFQVFVKESNPFITAQIQLHVVSGHVRLELHDVTNGDVYPPEGFEAATIAENTWIDKLGVAPGGTPEDNFWTRGTQLVELHVVQHGPDPAVFYVDMLQCHHLASFTEHFYGGRASNDLWLLAKEALPLLASPSAEYEVEAIDYERLGVGGYAEIVLGGAVQMLDTEAGIDFTTRIVKRTRNLYHEGDTQVEVEGRSNDLTRIQTETDRRIRRRIDEFVGYDNEGEELDPENPPADDDNLLECCLEAEAEHCSPDSAGDWENNPVCDILLGAAGVSEGTQIAWAADGKLTVTDPNAGSAGETNAAGTLKKTASNVLLLDSLGTLTNVVHEAGTAPVIEGGKLRLAADTVVRFTGFAPQTALVVQATVESTDGVNWANHHLVARMTSPGLDGYAATREKFRDALWRVDAGASFGSALDEEVNLGGFASFDRSLTKISVADGDQKASIGSNDDYEMSASDTAHNGDTGTAGMAPAYTGHPTLVSKLVAVPTDEITVTGMETGYKARVGTKVIAESGGTATLDLEGTKYPATTIEVLNGSDVVVASLTPNSGIYGGDEFEYDIDGELTDDSASGVVGRVDLDFLDSAGALISTASWSQPITVPDYVRRAGTTTIPASASVIRVMMRRVGGTQAIFCARRFMVNIGSVAAQFVPCELAGLHNEIHCVPTDEVKVLDLRFTNKYPKVNSSTNDFDPGTPIADTDGTIELSRRVFDSSVFKYHHRLETESRWAIGPNGLTTDPNPDGDFVFDWPYPVPGARGWGLFTKTWGDANRFGFVNNYTPSGIIVYDAPDVASIRGPLDEYNKMHGFTYFFWWQPAMETFWEHNLASVYHSTQNVEYNGDLDETFSRERAGWRFGYVFEPGISVPPHLLWVALELDDGFYVTAWESDDGGPCDPFFGEAADDSLHDDGNHATIPAFLAVRFSEQGTAPTALTHGHTGAGGASVFLDGTTDYAQSFVAPATGVITHVTITARQGDAADYKPISTAWLTNTLHGIARIVPDSGGSPGTMVEPTHRGTFGAAALPTSASSPADVTIAMDNAVPVTQGSTYWVVLEGKHKDDSPLSTYGIDGTHRIEIFGTDPGDDAGGAAKSGAYGGSWSAATIDLDYGLTGHQGDGDGIQIDVWLGNPRTGVLTRMGAANRSSGRSPGPGGALDVSSQSAVPVPRAFTAVDNASQPVIGNMAQSRDDSLELRHTFFGPAAGKLSAVVRHNRPCTDVEVAGAFVAGYRHEYEAACSIHEPDVTSEGETAVKATPCCDEGEGGGGGDDYWQTN